jgi:peroxiredoxin
MPSYQADLSRFEGYDTHVLGISVDSVPCNKAGAKSLGGISYDLLSDFEPKGEVIERDFRHTPPDHRFPLRLERGTFARLF